MRQNSRLFRLSASAAVSALLCSATLPAALAQPAPPPPPGAQAAPPDQSQADPPDRVGRIASASGPVSFRTSADTEWSAAAANYPVSSGNAFWTEPSGRAELEISANRIDLSGQTEFDAMTLDAGGLTASVPQGEIYLHLTELAPNEAWSIQTPRGTVQLTEAGRYGIVAGSADQPTQITVLEGAATLTGPGVSLQIAANQTATVEGNGPFQGSIGAETRDAFLAARLAAERPPAQLPPPVEARLRYLPEIGDLAGSGEWGEAPDYGEVWYPPVAPGWVPYQNGEWAYVAPWGWTWVDSAPWGFVPFHYGRWAHIGSRWGWLPGEARHAERPVYAPALVAFLGFSAGAAVGAMAAHGNIGWVPLGPGEAYHPWYHASEGYVRQINAGHVRDPAAINNPVVINQFANRGAATAVPAGVMLGSHQIRTAARPLSAATFATAHPVIGEQPIAPTPATLGVTPAVARQLNLVGGVARGAPGPAVRAEPTGAANGLPALIGPSHAGEPRPGAGNAPGGPLPLVVPGLRPTGMPAPLGARPPGEPGGPRPEGRPAGQPEIARPPGVPPLPTPGARPAGLPEPHEHESRLPQPPAGEPQPPHPQAAPAPEPAGHLPSVERPAHEAPAIGRVPEIRQALPPAEAPAPPHAVVPRVEQPRPEPPRPVQPPPRVEMPRPAPPPHMEQPRLAAPPPHIEPPHIEPPRQAAPPPERRPGER